jgi:small subunit ribosomal protein S6
MHPRRYETLILLSPNLSPADLDKFKGKVESILEQGKARVLQTEDWGRKVLAYPVKKEHYGIYILYDYQAMPAVEAELKRNLKIDENVFKSLTLVLDRQFTDERFEQEKERILSRPPKKDAQSEPDQQDAEGSGGPAPEAAGQDGPQAEDGPGPQDEAPADAPAPEAPPSEGAPEEAPGGEAPEGPPAPEGQEDESQGGPA